MRRSAPGIEQTASFMLRKKRRPGFSDSEPEFPISYMNRHKDWAVIVCLVGGGQEINTGEAGIDAWLDAVSRRFPEWEMFISSRLTDSETPREGCWRWTRAPAHALRRFASSRCLDEVVSRGECFSVCESAALRHSGGETSIRRVVCALSDLGYARSGRSEEMDSRASARN